MATSSKSRSTSSLIEEVTDICSKMSTRDRTARDLTSLLRSPHFEALAEVYDNLVAQNYSGDSSSPGSRPSTRPRYTRPGGGSQGTLTRGRSTSESISSDSPDSSTLEESYEMDLYNGNRRSGDFAAQTDEVPSNALRVLNMRKNDNEPLGMTVKEEKGRIEIARILAGSLVEKQGLLHVGDVIVAVNNQEVKTPEEFIAAVKRSSGSVTFKIIPSFTSSPPALQCYMRALFTYDPSQDTLLPCKELGIPFITGEVLEVLNREDQNWWQARRLIEPDSPVGLIPSQELEEMRRAFVLPEFDYSTKITICGTKATKKKKKEMYQLQQYQEFDKAELQLYEEVCRMPPFERKTLVLIGVQGVGRRTLKSRLIAYDPDRFATALPHTSRPIKENEEDGKQYHFVKRDIMEEDIANGKYLESGELQGHLYGIKLDSIRATIRSGKMCIIDCNPQCLKILKTKEFMPFVVFVAAPPIEQLRYMHEYGKAHGLANRTSTFDRGTFSRNSKRGRTVQSYASFYEDEDLYATIEESNRLYRVYETQYDLVITNNNFEKTFEQLREAVDALSTEPQWVPIQWVFSE